MSSNIEFKRSAFGAELSSSLVRQQRSIAATDVRDSHTRKESVRQSWIHTNENMNINNQVKKK